MYINFGIKIRVIFFYRIFEKKTSYILKLFGFYVFIAGHFVSTFKNCDEEISLFGNVKLFL